MNGLRSIIAPAFILCIALSACVAIDSGINSDFDFDNNNRKALYGSGKTVEITKYFTDFNALELHHTFNARIKSGNSYSIVIRIDDNLTDHLEAWQSGNRVYLGMDDKYNYKDLTLEAEITMPDISDIELSGASYAELVEFSLSHNFDIELSGASSLEGTIYAENTFINISGASSLKLNGEADDIQIDCSGASNIDLKYFEGDNAVIELSGASVTTLNISNTIRAHLSGASVLYYTGNPSFTQLSTSGQSRIIKL